MKSSRMMLMLFILLIGLMEINWQELEANLAKTSESNIYLPTPRLKSDVLLEDALGFEFSLGNRINDSFDLFTLGQLLWSVQGVTHPPFRAIPSAGATYPLELHVIPRFAFESPMTLGEYIYIPDDHSLKQVKEGDLFPDVMSVASMRGVETAPVMIIITAYYERTTSRYGERGIQYVHLEVGHALQNWIVQAKALYVDVELIVDFNQTLVSQLLSGDGVPLAMAFFWKTERSSGLRENGRVFTGEIKSTMQVGTTISVEEAIAARRSIREYIPGEIPLSHLTRLLEFSLGRRDPTSNRRVFHSPTGQYVVSIRLSVSNVFGLSDGVYLYEDDKNALILLNEESNNRELLWKHGLEQNWILEAQVVLVFTINLTKLQQAAIRSEIQRRVALFETGMIAQNIYLESYVLGLGAVVVGAFNEGGIRSAIEAGSEELPVYIMPVGKVTTFSYGTTIPPTLQFWSALISLVSIFFFFLTGLVMVPDFKKRFKRQALWLHFGFMAIFFILALVHVTLAHGAWSALLRGDLLSFLALLLGVVVPPLQTYYSVDDMALIIARLVVLLTALMILLALPFLFKISRMMRYRLFFIHKFLYWTSYSLLGLHVIINGYLIASYQAEFILMMMGATAILIYLYWRPKIVKNRRK